MHFIRTCVIIFGMIALSGQGPAASAVDSRQIILKFKQSHSLTTMNRIAAEAQDSLGATIESSSIKMLFDRPNSKHSRSASFIDQGLNRLVIIDLPASVNVAPILSRLQKNPDIEYAQVNHQFAIHAIPDDPLISDQWLINRISLRDAWDNSWGERSVIIGIIDTGIEYTHEDLNAKIWLNIGEDLNGNGRVDLTDFNHADDDSNGFVDDIHGWDFTDALHFPDGGDYRDRDNDPADEHGHGTAVAGIAAAAGNNGIGIVGVSPGCQFMNLRAGTSQGLLEEDDVASAIVYAVDNGARVINMSFGDIATSQMLRDVVQFAANSGCVLVASCGNSASAEVHYPSGLPGVISVGATDEFDRLASFSNFGVTVDVVAPGVNILTTSKGNQYAAISGTSAAAPVVSGLAALIVSQQPFLTNDDVRNILVSSTDDIGESGWDIIYGGGRINALKALQVQYASQAKITTPQLDDGFAGSTISIVGSASGALLQRYELAYGSGANPDEWLSIATVDSQQVIDDTLAYWAIDALPESDYVIRLSVRNADGSAVEDRTHIVIDRTAPRILEVLKKQDMVEANFHGALLGFTTDDITRASIFYRKQNSGEEFEEISLGYHVEDHRYFFSEAGIHECHFKVTNQSGLTTIENEGSHTIDVRSDDIETSRFKRLDYVLPPLYLIPKTSDFDGDGNRELIASEVSAEQSLGKLTLFEYENGQFLPVPLSSHVAIPRDFGDSDNDGLQEVLAGAGPQSFIFESPEPGAFPAKIVWSDSNDFWASRFADLDQDGRGEIIARIANTFAILEATGDNRYALIDSFRNPTEGTNGTGIPHVEIGDFDGDGSFEILMGDYDGDIYIYESTGNNQFTFIWSDRLPLMDAIDFIASGDYDGDGIVEFAAGCHSSPELDAEHEYDARHWLFRIYDCAGPDDFRAVWEQAFFGFASPADFASGLSSGDVNNDGRDELLINIFPDFYVIEYDGLSSFAPVGYFEPARSHANAIGDFNGDGVPEFFISSGEVTVALQDRSEFSPGGPPAPTGFRARPLDETHVQLQWQAVSGAQAYRIYRSQTTENFQPIAATDALQFIDHTVVADSLYWYRLAAIDSLQNPAEGGLTGALSARPGARPFCSSATFLPPNQVRLRFSETMDNSILDASAYSFSHELGQPLSAIQSRSGEEIILTLAEPSLPPGVYMVRVNNVSDHDRTPIDTTRNVAHFTPAEALANFYVVNAEYIQNQLIAITFSEAADIETALNQANYSIAPELPIESIHFNQGDSSQVHLNIDSGFPIGALGFTYVITVSHVFSRSGLPIATGQGSQASLVFVKNDLSNVFTYPNPCPISADVRGVTFANLTPVATIKILTLSGKMIRTIEEVDGNGGVTWDLKDENGNAISAGVYVYYVFNQASSRRGKFAVIK